MQTPDVRVDEVDERLIDPVIGQERLHQGRSQVDGCLGRRESLRHLDLLITMSCCGTRV